MQRERERARFSWGGSQFMFRSWDGGLKESEFVIKRGQGRDDSLGGKMFSVLPIF